MENKKNPWILQRSWKWLEKAYKCCASTSIRAGAQKDSQSSKISQNIFWLCSIKSSQQGIDKVTISLRRKPLMGIEELIIGYVLYAVGHFILGR